MVGGGIDPTKIPTGMEGPGRRAHNQGPGWVTEHAGDRRVEGRIRVRRRQRRKGKLTRVASPAVVPTAIANRTES